ncbi:restriction endonuclease [Gemmobacter denitrificans]|uniref:Restriction endonuclease n=1 Tax=Gemmobacter denitrificans TaxID=3123040 RepID=A0ABU8BTW3_9RHOB
MPVPDYQTLMLPVLRAFAEGATRVSDVLPRLRAEFQITEAEAEELLPSGTMTVLANRAHWARTYLSKAGLLESPRRNHHQITERGRSLLASQPGRIDVAALREFETFNDWREGQKGEELADVIQPVVSTQPEATPDEVILAAYKHLNSALETDLLELVYTMHPTRFEQLIIDLLNAMGYGARELATSMRTKASGDGGIDGIIHEDALGLDAVYIQAKRYAPGSNVGRPAIQQFVGSLTGEGATKGVFVTTSDFSAEARAYLNKVQHRIVLINGAEVARLMIQHGVGVRPRKPFIIINDVDEGYFAEVSGL